MKIMSYYTENIIDYNVLKDLIGNHSEFSLEDISNYTERQYTSTEICIRGYTKFIVNSRNFGNVSSQLYAVKVTEEQFIQICSLLILGIPVKAIVTANWE